MSAKNDPSEFNDTICQDHALNDNFCHDDNSKTRNSDN